MHRRGERVQQKFLRIKPLAIRRLARTLDPPGIIRGLRRGGLRVPDDIALVGFDGMENAQNLDTPLTTIRMAAEEMSREALLVLLRRIKEGLDIPPQIVVIPTKLIVGETTR